jgi:hypothetical protein
MRKTPIELVDPIEDEKSQPSGWRASIIEKIRQGASGVSLIEVIDSNDLDISQYTVDYLNPIPCS